MAKYQKYNWKIVDGPGQWPLTVSFWESLPGDQRIVKFTTINPETEERMELQMEVWVMGRGPSQGTGLFFKGPSLLMSEKSGGTYMAVGHAEISGYAIYNRQGKLTFKLTPGYL